MQLIVFCENDELKVEATDENIADAVQGIYNDENEVVILEDLATNRYIQTAGGWHIEYQSDLTQYVVDEIPLTVAQDILLSFHKQNNLWQSIVSWRVDQEITANLQSPRHKQDADDSIDLDTDFELDEDGNSHWTVSIDNWAPRQVESWRQLIKSYQRKLNNKSLIARYGWTSLVRPIWESHPLAGEKHWRHTQKQLDEQRAKWKANEASGQPFNEEE